MQTAKEEKAHEANRQRKEKQGDSLEQESNVDPTFDNDGNNGIQNNDHQTEDNQQDEFAEAYAKQLLKDIRNNIDDDDDDNDDDDGGMGTVLV